MNSIRLVLVITAKTVETAVVAHRLVQVNLAVFDRRTKAIDVGKKHSPAAVVGALERVAQAALHCGWNH